MAFPERVNLDWLEKNPGRLFHTDKMLEDRKLMLEDKKCSSCYFGCYKYEEQGLISTRQEQSKGHKFTNTQSPLRNLQISLSTDCNLACAYCSPEWSTKWHKEIEKNGAIKLQNMSIDQTNWSRLWHKLKQKNRSYETKFFSLLLREISLAKELQNIIILGGEPFLNNHLEQLIETLDGKRISIITGLGVDIKRLKGLLKKFKNKEINFLVSGESTGKTFEFLRYYANWEDFCNKVKLISDNGFKLKFISTITNIALTDFHNFYDKFYTQYDINCAMVRERPFMLPNVMDDTSKKNIVEWMKNHEHSSKFQDYIVSIESTPDKINKKNLENYLKQISNKRQIDLNFLPDHFLQWCGVRTV